MDRGEKLFRYDPAAPVSPLRPGIGKKEIEGFYAPRRQQMTNDEGSLCSQNPHILEVSGLDPAIELLRRPRDPLPAAAVREVDAAG